MRAAAQSCHAVGDGADARPDATRARNPPLPGPAVAPMSAREVGATLRLGRRLARRRHVGGRAGAVMPLGDDATRGVRGVAATFALGQGQLEAVVERGVLSRPVGNSGAVTLTWPLI